MGWTEVSILRVWHALITDGIRHHTPCRDSSTNQKSACIVQQVQTTPQVLASHIPPKGPLDWRLFCPRYEPVSKEATTRPAHDLSRQQNDQHAPAREGKNKNVTGADKVKAATPQARDPVTRIYDESFPLAPKNGPG